jgi:NADH:ubiquinone oxidoreductase subunit E
LEAAVSANNLKSAVTLAGSFCVGKCNRAGVTLGVDDRIYPGITPEGFTAFWDEKVMTAIKAG